MATLSIKEKLEGLMWALSPMIPESKKNDLLSIVKQKAEHYLPLIVEKTGVQLRPVVVKEYSDFFSDVYQQLYTKYVIEHPSEGLVSRLMSDYALAFAASMARVITSISPVGAAFCYDKGNLYVNMQFNARVMDMYFREYIERSDKKVVHELSHHLWHAINPKLTTGKMRGLEEGFADYCAVDHFADIYPDGTRRRITYKKDIEKVRQIVDKHGRSIVLELPKIGEQFLDSD
jgi:hypothetical protein